MAYLALKTDLTEQQRDYIEKIRARAGISDLVNDVLDFAKIESGNLELEVAAFDLDQLIDRGLHRQPARPAEGLALSFHVELAIPRRLVGDSLRIGQILPELHQQRDQVHGERLRRGARQPGRE